MIAADMTGDNSPRMIIAHQVEHFVVKNLAMFDSSLQTLLVQ